MLPASKLLDSIYLRYVAASGTALACDAGSFLLLLHVGVGAVLAASVSYGLGIFVNWYLTTRFVFDAARTSTGSRRLKQKGLFVASALLGLLLTAGIVAAGQWLGSNPLVSKLVAVVVSFHATYALRRMVVFAP